MKKKIAIVTILSIIVFCLLLAAISITRNSIFNTNNENIVEENEDINSSVNTTTVTEEENNNDNLFGNDTDEKSDVIEIENNVGDVETTTEYGDYEVTNNEDNTNELPGVPIE